LQRFEKTNEMLLNCNALSQSRFKSANEEFKKHVKLLTEMKKDLDHIFRKIRSIKVKVTQQYPVTYTEAPLLLNSFDEAVNVNVGINHPYQGNDAASIIQLSPSKEDGNHEVQKAITTVEYVQMEETIENGKVLENELIKRICSLETTNPNDSSDCTSEDTA